MNSEEISFFSIDSLTFQIICFGFIANKTKMRTFAKSRYNDSL